MKLLNLLKLIKPESLARARKRIRKALKHESDRLIYNNIFNQGTEGYLREDIYHVGQR